MPRVHWVWNGSTWKQTKSGGLFVAISAATNKQVSKGFVWDGSAWRQHYQMADPVDVTAVVNAWDKITLSWNSIAVGGTYVLKRGTTDIYSGALLTFQDTLLVPSTAYTYNIEAYLGGVLQSTDSVSATTSAYADPGLTGSSPAWWCNDISWTDSSQGSVDYYVLQYNGATIYENYASAGKSFRHQNLVPSAGYAYTLYCYRLPGTLIKTDTVTITTAGRTLSLSGYAAAYNRNHLDWTDSDGSTLTEYHLWRDEVGYTWIAPSARSYDDTGVGASQYHTYRIQGHRSDVGLIAPSSAQVGISTPARPQTYTWAYGSTSPDDNADGWTRSTARTLTGNNIQFVGGTNYLDRITFRTGGYDSNGRFEPFINGASIGNDYIYGQGRGWIDFYGNSNCAWGAGVYSTQLRVGGSGGTSHDGCKGSNDNQGAITEWGSAWWAAWSGQRWDYYVCTYGVYYWYYSSRQTFDDMSVRFEWMTPELAERLADRNLEMFTWCEPDDGRISKVQIGDRDTEELIVDWEERGYVRRNLDQREWAEWLQHRREERDRELPADA